jgi:hypothetical protein
MAYGEVEYDNNGKPICEICGKSFNRLLSHVRQKHEINEREYKLTYGLDLKKGICSKESSEKTRIKTLENFDKVIAKNLLKNGEKSRFKKGDKGRTKDKVSEQTRKRLVQHAKTNVSTEKRKELGRKLGLSGLGNKTQWGNA